MLLFPTVSDWFSNYSSSICLKVCSCFSLRYIIGIVSFLSCRNHLSAGAKVPVVFGGNVTLELSALTEAHTENKQQQINNSCSSVTLHNQRQQNWQPNVVLLVSQEEEVYRDLLSPFQRATLSLKPQPQLSTYRAFTDAIKHR